MEHDTRDAGERLLDRASALDSLVARLVMLTDSRESDRSLAIASRRELEAVRTLVAADDACGATCTQALEHLRRLDDLLRLAVAAAAEHTYALADRIAFVEEFELDKAVDGLTSARAVALADELAALC